MARWKSIVLGLGIILGGIAAALPFRHSAPPTTAVASSTPNRADEEDRFDVALQLAPLTAASPSRHGPTQRATKSPASLPKPPRASLEGLQPPPSLSSSFPTHDASSPADSTAIAPQQATSQLSQVHRLVDGDDLETLALQYYGDAKLWEVIYRANSDRLTSPDVLPIDVDIIIPSRDLADAASDTGLPRTSDARRAAD